MEETRRFLRYVIPGLVIIIEVSIYLWLSAHREFVPWVKEVGKQVAFPIIIFLASGGLGFLLAIIYHSVIWIPGISRLGVNHLPMIENAVGKGWLRLQRREDGKKINIRDMTQFGAWCVITSFWHERRESCPKIKGANPRTDSLTDIAHGLGTTLIGSIIVIPIWLFIHFKFSNNWPPLYCYIVVSIMLIVHFINFRRSVNGFQGVADRIILHVMEGEFLDNKSSPVVIDVTRTDLKKSKKNM